MSIISVAETWTGRMTGYDDKAVRKYKRAFIVQTSAGSDGPLTVRLAAGIPRLFEVYAEQNGALLDLGSRCVDVDVKQREDNPFLWDVVCEYSSESERPERANDNPFLRPSQISWDTQTYQVPATESLVIGDQFANGRPILNSAGCLFDPPAMKDEKRWTLTIERNELNFDPTIIAPYLANGGAINSDPWMGFDVEMWHVERISARSDYENGYYFWRVTYVFGLRMDTWVLSLLDHGDEELMPNGVFPTGPWKDIVRSGGGSPMRGGKLNGSGHLLAAGNDPVFLDFDIYPELPFNALNLP